MGIENNFEPTVEMPEELTKHAEGEQELTPEQLAGEPKKVDDSPLAPKQTGELLDWTEEPSDEEIAEEISNEINTAENMATEEKIETPTEPAANEQIATRVETDPEKIFEHIKDLVEAETSGNIPEGYLVAAKKQLEIKMNNPAFGRDRAIQETITYLKEKMGVADDLKALREIAKIPYRQAENLVNQYKSGNNEINPKDVISKLDKAKEAATKAKDTGMLSHIKQWEDDVNALNNARSLNGLT